MAASKVMGTGGFVATRQACATLLDMARPVVLIFSQHLPSVADPVAGVFVKDHVQILANTADPRVVRLRADSALRSLVAVEVTDRDDLLGGMAYTLSYRPLFGLFNYAVRVWAILRLILRLSREGCAPAILHVHWWGPALPVALAGRIARIPVVITEHGSHWPRYSMSRRQRFQALLAYRAAHVVISVSHWLAGVMAEQGVRRPLTIVPNAVDQSLFRPADRRASGAVPIVMMVARLYREPPKGIEDAISAIAILTRRSVPCELRIIGDGPDKSRYVAHASREGSAGMVTFLGRRSREEVAQLLKEADVFVSASTRYETFGVAVAEALSSGVPVVATRVGAIPELVSDRVGILVSPRSPADLADGIAACLRREWDPQLVANDVAFLGREPVRQRLLQVYRSLNGGAFPS